MKLIIFIMAALIALACVARADDFEFKIPKLGKKLVHMFKHSGEHLKDGAHDGKDMAKKITDNDMFKKGFEFLKKKTG